jgi:hypothetical protein
LRALAIPALVLSTISSRSSAAKAARRFMSRLLVE